MHSQSILQVWTEVVKLSVIAVLVMDFRLNAAMPILHQYFLYVLSGYSMTFQLQNSSFLRSLHVQRENSFFASLENETFSQVLPSPETVVLCLNSNTF